MEIVLFDTPVRNNLLPFTHTRPIADIRCGILTMRERWEHYCKQPTSTLTEAYLQDVFAGKTGNDNLYINGALFANANLYTAILQLQPQQKLACNNQLLAFRSIAPVHSFEEITFLQGFEEIAFNGDGILLEHVWDIFSYNDRALRDDYTLLTQGRKSAPIPAGVTVNGTDIFIEEGAAIAPGCIINTLTGPVYLAKDAEILEGTLVRGPLALGEHSVIKMGAKVYGATTLGPGCKVGGELNNVVFFANSNKAHDGYLGNAVIGEWCNLGADTNCSNLKNNYDEVKIWSEYQNKTIKTGLTFCGLLMGDHSKAGINTMFNTGTVVGVSCNVYGGGFPANFIPSFCWGGSDGLTTYKLNKATETANRMMDRRQKQLSAAELAMLEYIFNKTATQRRVFAHE